MLLNTNNIIITKSKNCIQVSTFYKNYKKNLLKIKDNNKYTLVLESLYNNKILLSEILNIKEDLKILEESLINLNNNEILVYKVYDYKNKEYSLIIKTDNQLNIKVINTITEKEELSILLNDPKAYYGGLEGSLKLIRDIGCDYDGQSTKSGYKSLIDDLVGIANEALAEQYKK